MSLYNKLKKKPLLLFVDTGRLSLVVLNRVCNVFKPDLTFPRFDVSITLDD